MNSPSLPTPAIRPAANPLPPWNQLPQERRHELTATLAAMILRQLPPRPSAPSEACDERP
jgi:hypothetical protein